MVHNLFLTYLERYRSPFIVSFDNHLSIMDCVGYVNQAGVPISNQYIRSGTTGFAQACWQLSATLDEQNEEDCDEMSDDVVETAP